MTLQKSLSVILNNGKYEAVQNFWISQYFVACIMYEEKVRDTKRRKERRWKETEKNL
jgi:hypothetical protein